MLATGTPCAAFADFFTDITTNGPRAGDLLTKAQAIQAAAIQTGQHVNAANALVAAVGSPDWPMSGNALAPRISAWQDICYPDAPPDLGPSACDGR
jgi:hypothetical protein